MESLTKSKMIRSCAALMLALFALTLVPVGDSSDAEARRRKKDKDMAGEMSDLTYVDANGFSVTFLKDWNIKVKEAESKVRVIAEKKDYTIPIAFRDAPLHTTIPTVKIYVDTTSMELTDFIDSLKSKSWSSDQKRDMYLEFKVLEMGEFERPRVSRLMLENGPTGRWFRTSKPYKIDVQRLGDNMADVVSDQINGDIAFFKNDETKTLIAISCVCEGQYYDINKPLFEKMVESFKFVTDEGDEEKAG